MVDEIIAKSFPKKTLKEHTEDIFLALENLKKLGAKLGLFLSEEEWKRLEKASLYHDIGKANTSFQNKIRNFCNIQDIPHNFLSLIFIPEEDETLLQMVAFHHWRDFPDFTDDIINQIYADIQKYLPKIKEYFNNDFNPVKKGIFKKRLEYLKRYYYKRIDGTVDIKSESRFIILLGLLNRLDHSASAGVPTEAEPIDKCEITKSFLLSKSKNPWQLKEMKDDFKNKNGCVIASTGLGKTEMALIWSDYQKTFYTLPIRTSVTAMYERLTQMFGEDNVGLLHSEALSSLFLNKLELPTDDILYHYDMAKNLSYPLIISTADQLFTATLKYFGFEKIYATLSYSKIIIDEIQSYSPHTIAIITHGINEITSLGGKFLVVTATFPKFLLGKLPIDFTIRNIPKLRKHKVELREEPLCEDNAKKFIISLQQKGIKKILIVCNTVKKAQQLYNALKEFSPILLHSRFARIDRISKEREVLNPNFEGILISTQVIEVSLDIDFDVLLTEMAPIDVLVQRMGRIYRKFKVDGDFYPNDPNIYIFTQEISGIGTIYEKELIKNSLYFLKNGIFSEEEKVELVENFYSEKNLKNTKYWTDFSTAYESIKYFSVHKKKEAQKIFREIMQVEIIPKVLLEREVENKKILSKLRIEKSSLINILEKIRIKDRKEKVLVTELIKDFMVPLPIYTVKTISFTSLSDYISNSNLKDFLLNIKVADCKYESDVGVLCEDISSNVI